MAFSASIDPGIRDCGVCLWRDREVFAAGLVVNPVKKGNDYGTCSAMAKAVAMWVALRVPTLDGLAIERPRVYLPSKQIKRDAHGHAHATDPNDLLPLVGVAVGIACLFPAATVTEYLPDAWKGQTDKIAMNLRAKGRLSEAERKRVDAEDPDPERPKAKGHNVWDAVGIGLHHFGRLDRVRVFPGAT